MIFTFGDVSRLLQTVSLHLQFAEQVCVIFRHPQFFVAHFPLQVQPPSELRFNLS